MTTRARLVGCGALVVLVTAVYQFVLPLSPGRASLASADLIDRTAGWRAVRHLVGGAAAVGTTSATLAVVAGCTLLMLAYGAAVATLWRSAPTRASLGIVLGTAVVLLACAVAALPNVSTDIYDYLLTARVLTDHGANPLLTAPDAFPSDPLLPYASPQYTIRPDNKLGLWVLASLPLAALGGDDPVRSLLLLRCALALACLLNVVLVLVLLRRLAPRHAAAGTALYAWNPVVAVYGPSKTDTLMVTFFLLSLLLVSHGRSRWPTLAVTASALVKLLTVPFAAVLLAGRIRSSARPVREAALQALLVVVGVAAVYQVFGRDPRLVLRHLSNANSPGWTAPIVVLAAVALAMAVLTLLTAYHQDGTLPRFLTSVVPLAVFAAATLGYLGFAWYATVPLALIALVRTWRAAAAIAVVSFVLMVRNSLDSIDTGTFHPAAPQLALQGGAAALLLVALALCLPAARRLVPVRQT